MRTPVPRSTRGRRLPRFTQELLQVRDAALVAACVRAQLKRGELRDLRSDQVEAVGGEVVITLDDRPAVYMGGLSSILLEWERLRPAGGADGRYFVRGPDRGPMTGKTIQSRFNGFGDLHGFAELSSEEARKRYRPDDPLWKVLSDIAASMAPDATLDTPTSRAALLARLRAIGESREVDFKGRQGWPGEGHKRDELLRDVLAMTNTRDGGYLVFGVNTIDRPVPLSDEQFDSFDPSRIGEQAGSVGSPKPTVLVKPVASVRAVILQIAPFADTPSICVRETAKSPKRPALVRGALYTRTSHAQTIQITEEDELTRLLEICWERREARISQSG